MKKTYAHTENGRKIFCKFITSPLGELFIEFYMPLAGYSYWYYPEERLGKVRLASTKTSADGRKFIVTYAIHPSFWAGQGFGNYKYYSVQDIINVVATRMFNFNVK